ncbi:MAG: ATP-binding protein [Candidatus Marinimicrobia bacterium]|nr:ATP-binding protein [Candidatus Neomarinimicrobiota bacterium]
MEDLSLHILDIVENSLRAGARTVAIRLVENKHDDILRLEIEDDGSGMDDNVLKQASNPFYSTKEGKKIGLGLALLSQAAEETGGSIAIQTNNANGTRIIACFHSSNIDMKPIGDIAATIQVLTTAYPEVNFSFKRIINE